MQGSEGEDGTDRFSENRGGVSSVFHYIPLHSAPAGKKYGRFSGSDRYTTRESERLLRLPVYYGMAQEDHQRVCDRVKEFYQSL